MNALRNKNMYRLPPLLSSLLLFVALSGCPSEPEPEPEVESLVLLSSVGCGACGGACTLENFQVNSRSHVADGVDYDYLPPVGGDHDPCWAPYGVHEEELAAENWVHNLEHGAIVLLYNCPEGCPDEVGVLSSVAASLAPSTVLVSSYSDMDSRFAAVSWGWRMLLDCADDPSPFVDFYSGHFAQAPETTTASPSAECME